MRSIQFLILSLLLAGCASNAAPEVKISQELTHGIDSPIFITAARQKDEITHAMRGAGFNVVDRVENGLLLLRVTVGTDQASKPCGALNNVRYQLRHENQTIYEVEGKGWTGTCQPNIFDRVSQELRRSLVVTTTNEGGK